MATETLEVRLLMKSGQYKREARDAATATGKIGSQAKTATTQTGALQSKMTGFGSVLRGAAVAGGIAALGRGVGEAIGQAEKMGSQYAITEQVLSQTGGVANLTAQDIKELSREQAFNTGVSKEMVTQGNNVLLTFKGIRNEVGEGNDVFTRTSDLMLDIAATMGTDAKSAALQLGKALNDPVANMGALSRAGLTFSAAQKQQIKDLVANNDLLGAQKLILGELESQLGGTAEASVDATAKMARAWDEVTEAVGTGLLPFVESLATELGTITGLVDELDRVAAHAGGAAESAEAFLTVVAEQTGGAGFLNGINRGIETFILGITPGIDHMTRFREELEGLVPRLSIEELQRARTGINQMGQELGLTRSEMALVAEVLDAQLVVALGGVTQETHDAGLRMLELNDATEDVTEANEDAIPTIEEIAAAEDEQAEATRRTIQAMADKRNALREIHNPLFAMTRRLEDLADAQEEVEKLEDRGKQGTQDYKDAVLQRAEVIADLEQTLKDLQSQGIDPTGAAAREMLEGLGVPPNVISEIFAEFDRLQADFEGRRFTMTMSVPSFHFTDSGGVVQGTGATISGIRHSGGPVSAGNAYIWQPGDEVFIPDRSGTIVPKGETASTSMMSGGSSGPTYVFYGDVYGDEGFMRKVREANVQNGRLGLN